MRAKSASHTLSVQMVALSFLAKHHDQIYIPQNTQINIHLEILTNDLFNSLLYAIMNIALQGTYIVKKTRSPNNYKIH